MCWFCTVTVTYLVIHISAWTFDALQASRPQTELPHSVLIVCQRGGGGGGPPGGGGGVGWPPEVGGMGGGGRVVGTQG